MKRSILKNQKMFLNIGISAKIMILFFLVSIGTVDGHPEAYFYIQDWALVNSNNDSIYSGTHIVQNRYSIIVGNTDDDSNTVLSNISYSIDASNIIDINNKNYAHINGSFIQWIFPPEKQIDENKNFNSDADTDIYKSINVPMDINRWTNQSIFYSEGDIFQLAKFNVTFYDPGQIWGQIEAWDINRSNITMNTTVLPDTFSTDAPLSSWWGDSGGISFNFNNNINLNRTYYFSVVTKLNLTNNNDAAISSFEYKPAIRIAYLTGEHRTGETNFTTSMPVDMLPDNFHHASASSNILNQWRYDCVYFKGMYIKRIFNIIASTTPTPTQIPTPTPTDTPIPTPSPTPASGNDVVSRYAGIDHIVQKSEVIQAVIDYFNSVITKQDAIAVVLAYFNG